MISTAPTIVRIIGISHRMPPVRSVNSASRTTSASESPTAARRTARKLTAPGVEDLAGRLSDVFETKVKVQIGRAKGRIVVEFGSVDDLQRIIGVMAPEIAGRRSEA